MRIVVAGAGPAGCAAALSLRRRLGDRADLRVYERDARSQRRGFGLVLAPWQLARLAFLGHDWAAGIRAASRGWSRLAVIRDGERVDVEGHPLSAISRDDLLDLLRDRMAEAGIPVVYGTALDRPPPGTDLLVAADGIDSAFRAAGTVRRDPPTGMRFVWFATAAPFPELTFLFQQTRWGMFTAHAYSYRDGESVFIVEAAEPVWNRALESTPAADGFAKVCADAFAGDLDGAALYGGSGMPRRFAQIQVSRWTGPGSVLIGDAAHTAHFSIGSGTSLALADAAGLADAMAEHDAPAGPDALTAALDAFETARRPPVETAQDLSRDSSRWFATVDERWAHLDAAGLAESLVARTGLAARVRRFAAGGSR